MCSNVTGCSILLALYQAKLIKTGENKHSVLLIINEQRPIFFLFQMNELFTNGNLLN